MDIRNAWLCMGVVAAAALVIWPVAEMPYGDDTAYTHIALNVARTGHLAYNGWESAVLVLHAYWGALFIRLFGFSFNCVRFSTIPFALGAVGLCYLLVRRAGLQAPAAVFVTLLFGLSPLFLPLSVSFMTDVPGFFFMFASFYALFRAAQESIDVRGYGWLALSVAMALIRGTRVLHIVVAVLFLVLIITLLIHPSLASIPWVSNTLNWEGINGSAPLPGRPIVLTRPIRALAAVSVYSASLILMVKLANTRGLPRRVFNLVVKPSDSQFALAAVSLFSIAYLALVVIPSVHFDVFDRYLLPILPWTATALLMWFESEDRVTPLVKKAMPIAWALLAVLALYAITSTQDLWALARARVSATRELEAAGVPRKAIEGGF